MFLGPSIPPTPNSGIPRKRFHPTMITSPDGKGVIISGGFILTGSNGWKMKYLTTLIELRLNGTSNEFFWTVLDQRMKIPREGPVMFTVPDDYCIQQDFITHFLEHTSMIWIGLTIVGIVIILGLLSIASYMARRYCKKRKEIKSRQQKIQTIYKNELSTWQIFEENNPSYEQIHKIEVTSLHELFVGNIEKEELIGNFLLPVPFSYWLNLCLRTLISSIIEA